VISISSELLVRIVLLATSTQAMFNALRRQQLLLLKVPFTGVLATHALILNCIRFGGG